MIGERKLLTKPSKPGNTPWDNENHDLILHTGDVIYSSVKKYSVISMLGKGTFGQVVECIDQDTEKKFALKVSKSPRIYYSCSRSEAQILERLRQQKTSYFVEVYSTFIFKQHHCIVLELLGRNLYEMLKLRNFNGFSHDVVKNILRQVLGALIELAKIGVVHCDLKPENVLVKNPYNMQIKIIDFGSAFYHFKEKCFYVQSRYYRAPEVLMNMTYNSAVDIWSFICIAFELYVGRPLFPGSSNNDQLARIFYLLEDTPQVSCSIKEPCVGHETRKDTFLSKDEVRKLISKCSSNYKNNQNLYDLLFFVLKIRAVERPDPATILQHSYLSDTLEHDDKRILQDTYEVVEARDQYHPPPQILQARRYTSSTTKVKDNTQENRRKKSYFQNSYKST